MSAPSNLAPVSAPARAPDTSGLELLATVGEPTRIAMPDPATLPVAVSNAAPPLPQALPRTRLTVRVTSPLAVLEKEFLEAEREILRLLAPIVARQAARTARALKKAAEAARKLERGSRRNRRNKAGKASKTTRKAKVKGQRA